MASRDTRGRRSSAWPIPITSSSYLSQYQLLPFARGQHLIEADLLAALDAGHLSGATLDVFATEPLPPEHPFWRHPAVLVTPHTASLIDPAAGSGIIARNLRDFAARGTVADLADAERGY